MPVEGRSLASPRLGLLESGFLAPILAATMMVVYELAHLLVRQALNFRDGVDLAQTTAVLTTTGTYMWFGQVFFSYMLMLLVGLPAILVLRNRGRENVRAYVVAVAFGAVLLRGSTILTLFGVGAVGPGVEQIVGQLVHGAILGLILWWMLRRPEMTHVA